jgi:hypothetical protein
LLQVEVGDRIVVDASHDAQALSRGEGRQEDEGDRDDDAKRAGGHCTD